jgi:hypothetical protein
VRSEIHLAVDIEDGDAGKVQIDGAACCYVLTVVVDKELEMSVYTNDKPDLVELRAALEEGLSARRALILLRAESATGTLKGWQALDAKPFVARLPKA